MAELKTYYTKLALEPFESYGLTPLTVTAVTDQGCSVSLELCVSPAPSSSAPSSSAAAEPGGSTRNVLFLLDRFGVSDEFYHEVYTVYHLTVTILWNGCVYNSYHLYSLCMNIVPYFTGCKGAPPAAPCQAPEKRDEHPRQVCPPQKVPGVLSTCLSTS